MPHELERLKILKTPMEIQDFLDSLEINFERHGDTCMSPIKVLQTGRAHCMEAAMLAAAILRMGGFPPLVVDLTASNKDFDHVIAVFKMRGKWGAISKTNRAFLGYRDPLYLSIRELVLSYFNEYFLDDGTKTLRTYSMPINLSRFNKLNWINSDEDVWYIPDYLANVKHFPIIQRGEIKTLRKADGIEIAAGRLMRWRLSGDRTKKVFYSKSFNGKAEI